MPDLRALLFAVSITALAVACSGDDSPGAADAAADSAVADAALDVGATPDAEADAASVDASPPDAGSTPMFTAPFIAGDVVVARARTGDFLLDVRSEALYAAGHIEGAQRVNVNDLRANVDGIAGQVAGPAAVAAALSTTGLAPTDDVVIYDSSVTTTAARLAWTLAYYGHQGQVAVLAEGYDALVARGAIVTTEIPLDMVPGYEVGAVTAVRSTADEVLAGLDDAETYLVDARSAGEYSAGRIPGARSADWTTNLDGDGALLPLDDLNALYADLPMDGTIITYCQTGSRASVTWAVLTWLGYPDVRLYDGSWAEWGSRSELPTEMD